MGDPSPTNFHGTTGLKYSREGSYDPQPAHESGKDKRVPTELKEIEELRTQHQVRLVTDEEDGTGIDRLPNGVYGFTYSPASENFPLFKKRDLNSYEAHKLPNGSTLLVGYSNKDEADAVETSKEAAVLHLFPDPKGDATSLVVLPMARVVGHRENSQREGKGFEVRVSPAS
jgi:hypothetical protein